MPWDAERPLLYFVCTRYSFIPIFKTRASKDEYLALASLRLKASCTLIFGNATGSKLTLFVGSVLCSTLHYNYHTINLLQSSDTGPVYLNYSLPQSSIVPSPSLSLPQRTPRAGRRTLDTALACDQHASQYWRRDKSPRLTSKRAMNGAGGQRTEDNNSCRLSLRPLPCPARDYHHVCILVGLLSPRIVLFWSDISPYCVHCGATSSASSPTDMYPDARTQ